MNAEVQQVDKMDTNTQDGNEEPYPITPPINDNEESIAVEESVVNYTVLRIHQSKKNRK